MRVSCYLTAALYCCLIACNTKYKAGGRTGNAATNLSVFHNINKAVLTGDTSHLGEYIAVEAIDHSGELHGLETIKLEIQKSLLDSIDKRFETIREFADDEYVIAWMKFTGISKKQHPDSQEGSVNEAHSVQVTKFRHGKAIEHWTFIQPGQ
jgi:hypothetical protein